MQENISRFEALNAQVLGISVDSVYSHQAFADSLGGISFPQLADFHPKGEVIKQYGLWKEEWGAGKRAIIIIDTKGIVRYSEIVSKGMPDIDTVLGHIEALGFSKK